MDLIGTRSNAPNKPFVRGPHVKRPHLLREGALNDQRRRRLTQNQKERAEYLERATKKRSGPAAGELPGHTLTLSMEKGYAYISF